MKKYLILIALLSAVVLASGCVDSGNQTTNQTSDIATKTYTNDTAGYSFEYPASWQKVDFQSNNTTGVVFRDGSSGTNVIVTSFPIDSEPTDEELTTFLTQLESQYGTGFEGYEKVSSNTVTIKGVKGVEMIYKLTEEGQELQQKQVWLFKSNMAYLITLTAQASDYASEAANFDLIVNSFKIQ